MSAPIESAEGQPFVAVYSWGVTYEDQSCQRDNLRKWKASAVRELAELRCSTLSAIHGRVVQAVKASGL